MTRAAEPVIVLFGNPNPQQVVAQLEGPSHTIKAPHLEQSVTRIEFADHAFDEEKVNRALSTDNDRLLILISNSLEEKHRRYSIAVHEAEQIMAYHAGGSKPTWVSSNDPDLAEALAGHFGCALGEPTNLLTNAGRDALHEQSMGTSQPASFQYGALSASATTLLAADTALVGEITTAGGGLIRAKMTFAHTSGTNTSTLTNTWVANGSDVLPVTLKKWANFNKATPAGTVECEDELSSSATLSAIGDSITVTSTITWG